MQKKIILSLVALGSLSSVDDFYVKNSDSDATKNGSVGWNEYRFIMNNKF
ncbi:MAG: hypothetical protein ABGW74_00765 [Campylobacterales bacterium]|jgi:hypothetical protein